MRPWERGIIGKDVGNDFYNCKENGETMYEVVSQRMYLI